MLAADVAAVDADIIDRSFFHNVPDRGVHGIGVFSNAVALLCELVVDHGAVGHAIFT